MINPLTIFLVFGVFGVLIFYTLKIATVAFVQVMLVALVADPWWFKAHPIALNILKTIMDIIGILFYA
jgi:hypothetical protein